MNDNKLILKLEVSKIFNSFLDNGIDNTFKDIDFDIAIREFKNGVEYPSPLLVSFGKLCGLQN